VGVMRLADPSREWSLPADRKAPLAPSLEICVHDRFRSDGSALR
jgi:hypothetical protein